MSRKEKVEISKEDLMDISDALTALWAYIAATNEKPPKYLYEKMGWNKKTISDLIFKSVKNKAEEIEPVTVLLRGKE